MHYALVALHRPIYLAARGERAKPPALAFWLDRLIALPVMAPRQNPAVAANCATRSQPAVPLM